MFKTLYRLVTSLALLWTSAAYAAPEFQVSQAATMGNNQPTVAQKSDGSFIVAWTGQAPVDSRFRIYFRRYSASGVAEATPGCGTDACLASVISTGALNPSIGLAPDGSFVLGWNTAETGNPSTRFRVWQARFGADGSRLATPACAPSTDECPVSGVVTTNDVAVASSPYPSPSPGRYVVAWTTFDDTLRFKRFDAGGNAVDACGDAGCLAPSSGGNLGEVRAAMHIDGSFVLAWRDTSNTQAFFTRYDNTGTPVASGGCAANTACRADQTGDLSVGSDVRIGMDAGGNFTLGWVKTPSSGGGELFFRRYTAAGVPRTTTGCSDGECLALSSPQGFTRLSLAVDDDSRLLFGFHQADTPATGDASDQDVFIHQRDANGQALAAETGCVAVVNGLCRINQTQAEAQQFVSVALRRSQTPVAAWERITPTNNGGDVDARLLVNEAPPPPPSDTTPDAFSFTDVTGAALNTAFVSNTITISGMDAAAPVSFSGGDGDGYSIGCTGSFTRLSGSVSNGQTIRLRVRTEGTPNFTHSATLTVGGVADTYSVTTGDNAPPPPPPPPASQNAQGSTGGGAFGLGLLPLALLALRRQRRKALAAGLLLAPAVTLAAPAMSLTGSIGAQSHGVSDRDLSRGLQAQGFAVDAKLEQSSPAYGMALGLHLHPRWVLELGLAHHGEYDIRAQGSYSSREALTAAAAEESVHAAGKAVSLALRWQSPAWKGLRLEPQLGVFHSQRRTTLRDATGESRVRDRATGMVLGAQVLYPLQAHFSAGVGSDYLWVPGHDGLLRVQAVLRWMPTKTAR